MTEEAYRRAKITDGIVKGADIMSYIKRWMEEVYYEHECGATVEELASKYETEPEEIRMAIKIMQMVNEDL